MDRLPDDLSSLDRYPSTGDLFDVLDALQARDDGGPDPERVAEEVRELRRFVRVLVAMARGSWSRLGAPSLEPPHQEPPY